MPGIKKDNSDSTKSNQNLLVLVESFYKASKISFSLVFFPIVILLIGVWVDKKINTTPLFIVVGIISGVIIAIYQSTKVRKEIISQKEDKDE